MDLQFEIYQWLVPLISILFIVRTIRQYRSQKRKPMNMVIWVLFWVFIAVLAIIPNAITFKIAKILGFKSNISAIIFVALGVLYFMVYNLTLTINKLESRLTDLVRKLALEEKNNDE